jgi:4-hydroxy-3-methylbut-2-en-1-yl diphosphate reductase
MKRFEIPAFYRSSILSRIKERRRDFDPRKKDFSPTKLKFGDVEFLIARHFGFCYGVENAIEIAYKALEENSGRRIFLLSEMIHNPGVNRDLINRGINFLMDTSGNEIYDWSKLTRDDIVIIPAFGTTLELEKKLNQIGINPYRYNTTCPFVEKVWNRSSQLGNQGYTIIIHGKHNHEETRATFSHTVSDGPALIVRNLEETKILGEIILGNKPPEFFYTFFEGKYSKGFDINVHLKSIGVVNQTTMLASETEDIANYLKEVMVKKYGSGNLKIHFADTRDTLCYATNDNQEATYGVLEEEAHIAIVVGGYNSSNTTHIVELCSDKLPTYFISSAEKIISADAIKHFDITLKEEKISHGYLSHNNPVKIVLTSGASCPDAVVDQVLVKILSFFPGSKDIEEVLKTIIY